MTVAEARAKLVDHIDNRIAVEVAGFKAAYLTLARENVEHAIEDLIEACKQQGAHDENARLQEVGRKYLAEHAIESDPKEGGHA